MRKNFIPAQNPCKYWIFRYFANTKISFFMVKYIHNLNYEMQSNELICPFYCHYAQNMFWRPLFTKERTQKTTVIHLDSVFDWIMDNDYS